MAHVSIRYIVDDVAKALAFYTTHLGFALELDAVPAFASVTRDDLRLLLSGPLSSGGRKLPDGRQPVAGGWNRLLLIVSDIDAEVAQLKAAGIPFRSEILPGVGGSQIVLDDPAGNPIELFQPKD